MPQRRALLYMYGLGSCGTRPPLKKTSRIACLEEFRQYASLLM